MLISWNWLGKYVNLEGLSPREVGEQFTLKVAELDSITHIGAGLDGVMAARVIDVKPHTDSKKLSIVKIDDGNTHHTLICGAPNVRGGEGQVVAWVTPGTQLPNGQTISVAEVRGIVSHGMLASEAELGLSDEHDGIILLPSDTPIGVPIGDVVPYEDWVWEVDNKAITHRADLWGHLGIAREVSMLTGRPLHYESPEVEFGDANPIHFNSELPTGCHRYLCTRIDDVKVQPSPMWLQRLLSVTGIRPISNLVDLTNFVMLETGNPLHAFDNELLQGDNLKVSRASDGTTVKTLDGQERTLDHGTLLICDGEGPVAVAGVMGCLNSQIEPTTTSLILEAACFDAEQVRKTSTRLGLRTESSARFEKALAPETAKLAAQSFCRNLKEICPDAKLAYKLLDTFPTPPKSRTITVSIGYVRQRLGVEIALGDATRILEALGLRTVVSGEELSISVPYWRAGRDLNHAEDIIEELGRSVGYYAIPPVAPSVHISKPQRRIMKRFERTARRVLSSEARYHEVVTYSFGHTPTEKMLGMWSTERLELANPISSEWLAMRQSLIPNLIKIGVENRRFEQSFGIFEVGRVFQYVSSGLGAQPRRLGWLEVAPETPTPAEANLVRQRDLICRYLDGLNLGVARFESGLKGFESVRQWIHPNRILTLFCGDVAVGYLGTLHPRVARKFQELGADVWFGELELERLIALQHQQKRFKHLPKFPAIPYDLSLEVPVAMRASELTMLVEDYFSSCALFESVELFSVYIRDDSNKSLSLRFRFRSEDRSLSDAEVNPLMDELISTLHVNHGLSLRPD